MRGLAAKVQIGDEKVLRRFQNDAQPRGSMIHLRHNKPKQLKTTKHHWKGVQEGKSVIISLRSFEHWLRLTRCESKREGRHALQIATQKTHWRGTERTNILHPHSLTLTLLQICERKTRHVSVIYLLDGADVILAQRHRTRFARTLHQQPLALNVIA